MIGIFGNGLMGQELENACKQIGQSYIVLHSDEQNECDVIIDFSHPENLDAVVNYSLNHKKPVVICTTGFSQSEEERIVNLSKVVPVIYTQNTSLGVNILSYLVEEATRLLVDYDVEIIEKHHNQKNDAPSGTAKLLLSSIKKEREDVLPIYGRNGITVKREQNEVGIHAIRGGTIYGEHTVLFASNDEVIELKHEALSKRLFAKGSLIAANYIINKDPGMYTMRDVLGINGGTYDKTI